MSQVVDKPTTFAAALERRPQGGPRWLDDLRSRGAAKFAALGIPTVRDEEWRFTNVSALGSLKPGLVRRWATSAVLWVIDFAARHVYTRGRLARVRTIHFARWVFLDGKTRVIFLSNYDDSLDSYMDDFINKVGFGLNVSFSHGIGYPRTRWLIFGGSADERNFKEFLRRHQIPTQVWYRGYPGLTAVDLERNSRVRRGIDMPQLGDQDAAEWVALL